MSAFDAQPETHRDEPSGQETHDANASSQSIGIPNKKFHSKKVVLVTGGAGFIGSHVAEALLKRGDDVVIVDEVNDFYDKRIKRANLARLQAHWGPDRLRVFEGDICDEPFISHLFELEKPKWIVHLAARAGVRPSIQDPFIYIHSNVTATTRLLELARTHGNESFVFASSSSVYGGSCAEVFKETDVVDYPVSPYAATKKACELMAFTYHHLYGLNISGLRFFTVYGPRGRPDMAPFKVSTVNACVVDPSLICGALCSVSSLWIEFPKEKISTNLAMGLLRETTRTSTTSWTVCCDLSIHHSGTKFTTLATAIQ
jgi:NAD(P)-dependent dehydrogenase (short-subunit alcohol dehydrogenase family)